MTAPYYQDSLVTVHLGDCITVMRSMPDASVHAIVTDPPYGLEFMGKGWDGADGFRRSMNEADTGRENVFGRTSAKAPEYRTKLAGKMSQIGEADGTPFRRSTGTPSWGASGNPSCLNCGGQKYGKGNPCNCASPEFPNHMAGQMHAFQQWCELWAIEALRVLKPGGYMLAFGGSRTWHRLAVAVEDAGFEIRDSIAWLYGSGFPKGVNLDGDFAGWGTGLKPAFEPIVVARKPLTQTVVANMAEHGTGAIHIAANRVGDGSESHTREGEASAETRYTDDGAVNLAALPGVRGGSPDGRWPTNVLLEHSQADALDVQVGILTSGKMSPVKDGAKRQGAAYGTFNARTETGTYGDSGGASRFFPTFHYEAKAPGSERPDVDGVQHPTVKPLDLMRWLVRLVASPGAVILEPFAGSGTTLEAALLEGFHVIGIEKEAEYLPLIMKRITKPLQQSLFGEDIA